MEIDISTDNDQFIEQAIADGRFTNRDDVVNQAVQILRMEHTSNGKSDRNSESIEEWVADLRAWAASHKGVTHFVDDSRESIYDGCGE